MGKHDNPTIKPQDYTEMMELDIAVQQALNKNKNGLGGIMRTDLDEEMLKLPEHFNMLDVRKPPKQHVDDKLRGILDEIFGARSRVEKTLTRNELVAYDKVLLNYLTHEVLMPKLKSEVESDYHMVY